MTDKQIEKKRVAVVMSTYNGERYIEEQIESILKQTGVDVFLYIRDDGSKDGTISILKKYETLDQVNVIYGENIGIGMSFMSVLLSLTDDYDAYAFSDQDDIWAEDKLACALSFLDREEGCVLYASNLERVDADNHSQGLIFDKGQSFDHSLLFTICSSKCYGCTQVFSRELFQLVKERRVSDEMLRLRLHDSWISVSAAAAGKIIFDPNAHIRYRRHGDNYTSFDQGKAVLWKQRFHKLFHANEQRPRSKMALEVIRRYPEYVEKNPDKELILALAHPLTLRNRVFLIRNRKRFIAPPYESDFLYIIKAVAGWI